MDVEDLVRSHYGGTDLEAAVLRALAAAGVRLDWLSVADLGPVDQLHMGGLPATDHLLEQLGLSSATRLLDVGAGLGGPARRAAERYGCVVVAVDLSPDFVAAGERLTERLGLAELVSHLAASGEQLELGNGSFDRAMMVHVGMNLEHKRAVFAEVRRVLGPGGLFVLYEQVRVGEGPLTYPLPWAEDERSSFVSSLEDYRAALDDAGFVVERVEDRTAATVGAGAPNSSVGPDLPPLSPAAAFGPAFRERLGHQVAAVRAGLLAPVLVVARAA